MYIYINFFLLLLLLLQFFFLRISSSMDAVDECSWGWKGAQRRRWWWGRKKKEEEKSGNFVVICHKDIQPVHLMILVFNDSISHSCQMEKAEMMILGEKVCERRNMWYCLWRDTARKITSRKGKEKQNITQTSTQWNDKSINHLNWVEQVNRYSIGHFKSQYIVHFNWPCSEERRTSFYFLSHLSKKFSSNLVALFLRLSVHVAVSWYFLFLLFFPLVESAALECVITNVSPVFWKRERKSWYIKRYLLISDSENFFATFHHFIERHFRVFFIFFIFNTETANE